ncbi:MAG: hypothetical protein ACO1QR_12135 [Chthoniobacteraceae bacterium]
MHNAFRLGACASPSEREATVRRMVEAGDVQGDVGLIAFRHPAEREKASAAKLREKAQRFHSRSEP